MSQDTAENNKRIAKNTLMLYVRMLILMSVALYTSRVLLKALGVDNFGIYNVVGGVVMMFSIISSSLSNAISRFITFEIGHGDKQKLQRIFSTAVTVQIAMALTIGLLIEIIGIWFLHNKLNIPPERMFAANWVLHCTTLSFMIGLITLPYNATIIAHERMSAFAYFSIFEVMLKLLIVYLLYISHFDKLIVYAVLVLCVSVVMQLCYRAYSKKHFPEAHYTFLFDKQLFREMAGFAGWNLFGNTAYMLNTQGVNMLINVFFGVTFNAARGIATQVDGAVSQFVNNFMTAINPQITKSYAAGDIDYLVKLVCSGTKYSYYIMYFFIVPIVLEADTILSVWLVDVPEGTAMFMRLVLFSSLTTVMGNSMLTAILATGRIRKYQIIVVSIGWLAFPFTWIAYKFGAPAYVAYIIYAAITFNLNFIRVFTLKKLMGFPVRKYVIEVLPNLVVVSVVSFLLPSIVVCFMPQSFLRIICTGLVSVLWVAACVYFLGINSSERHTILAYIRKLPPFRKN